MAAFTLAAARFPDIVEPVHGLTEGESNKMRAARLVLPDQKSSPTNILGLSGKVKRRCTAIVTRIRILDLENLIAYIVSHSDFATTTVDAKLCTM